MALEEALLASTKKFKEDRDKIKDSVSKELEEAQLDAQGMKQLLHLKNKVRTSDASRAGEAHHKECTRLTS